MIWLKVYGQKLILKKGLSLSCGSFELTNLSKQAYRIGHLIKFFFSGEQTQGLGKIGQVSCSVGLKVSNVRCTGPGTEFLIQSDN